MLSSALVVFREVFEIVLIVGIILAVTRTMPNRKKAIAIGFGTGLAGSALIAVFTGQISSMAEGLGQEYFNAGILLTAAAFIAWTVLWMKKHARHIKKHFQDVERAIETGKAPYIALSGVIGLAMLREGAEIVLFIYGMLAAGQSPGVLAAGSALGFVGGLAVGLMVYFGLIKLSIKIFFQVTSVMLAFLVAGMVSQGVGFLVAAGMFENLSQTAWDTSAFLTEDGIIGQSIGVLVGYTARPAIVQVIAYAAALSFIMTSMRMIDKNISLLSFFKKPAHA